MEVTGRVEEIVYRNEENGYTVLEIDDGRDGVTAVGIMPMAAEGQNITVTGEWSQHRDFGPQLKVTAYRLDAPTGRYDIMRYLASGLIEGVGAATAKKLVDAFGEQTLDVLRYDPARIAKVPGIGKRRAEKIAASYAKSMVMEELMLFLQGHGVSVNMAVKVYKRYGEEALTKLQENPYRLVEDIEGIGFQTADRIALSMGVEKDAPFRLNAGARYAMQDALGEGHVYLPLNEAVEKAAAMLNVPIARAEEAFLALQLSGGLKAQGAGGQVRVYLPAAFAAECEVARQLVVRSGETVPASKAAFKAMDAFLNGDTIETDEKQVQAVRLALEKGCVAITGGPGTGKTTIIRCILYAMEAAGMKVLLAAPTGRAAKRMGEATDRSALTLHRLLEYGGGEERFQRDEDNPLKGDALVVDEASMVDIFLMHSLLKAMPMGMRLILVGDADQLPSVGAGNVLRDVIASGQVPCVRLQRIFRQAAESLIVTNAHRINRGEMPLMRVRDKDFFFVREENINAVGQTVVDLVTKRLPGFIGLPPESIQVLAPARKGPAGVNELNKLLREAINPPAKSKPERSTAAGLFRRGDRVMQVHNDYQATWVTEAGAEGEGVFNGDMGVLEALDTQEATARIAFDDGRYAEFDYSQLDEMEPAYAVTVHKSQGSEFDAVVIPLVSGPPMLFTRNLLYTAVTRAKKLVVLVGRESCIRTMVENDYILRRYSALDERMKALEGWLL